MLELQKGIDILSGIGGIQTRDQAHAVFEAKCDADNLAKMAHITNETALLKIANAISMMDPDSVFVNSGSEDDVEWVRLLSLARGEEKPLATRDHTVHFDLPEDQGRLLGSTFYIVNPGEETSTLAKSLLRDQAYEYVKKSMTGIAKGQILLVGFFNRGPIGARAAIPALEITTSAYVMHSANILYRNAYWDFDREVERVGHFFTNVHSEGPNRPQDLPNARVFMDRSWQTTFSMFCTYAGNTLLLKKGNHRFAVDLATYYHRQEQLSEHMYITGVTGPGGRTTYIAGAAPSGCGKTTTAMVGTDFIGDDLAQLWIADDGTLRAINPEKGIFGIVEDVSQESDPHLMEALRKEGAEVIWSNVLVDVHGVPHWTGHGEEIPQRGVNYQGMWWQGKIDDQGASLPPSNPNARCTLENKYIGNYNAQAADDPHGVVVEVITYSGRDSNTMPPVWVAKTPDQGVVIGASILSAATATEVGANGVRRQPWANEPFIPGPLGDYMTAQFEFFNADKLTKKPIVSGLNYFLTHSARGGVGKGLLGEKRDVKPWLAWLELYAHGDVKAIETPIGFIPQYEELKPLFAAIDKAYPEELYNKQFSFYVDNIIARIDLQEEAYRKESNIPAHFFEIYEEQRHGLEALKARYGSIILPAQLAEAAGA